MKEYRLEIKIKNNYLLSIMEKRGILNVAELSRLSGVSITSIYGYLGLTISPLKKTGEYKDTVKKIAELLDYDPEFLFPENFLVKISKIMVEVSTEEIKQMYDNNNGLKQIETTELQKRIDIMLETLLPREEEVLKKRFGIESNSMTLRQIGESMNVSNERVRQIEGKALRKIRNSKRSNFLKEMCTE